VIILWSPTALRLRCFGNRGQTRIFANCLFPSLDFTKNPSLTPISLTMLPAPNSPAINAGLNSVCAATPVSGVDQRGAARPIGARCDIGAVESDTIFANGFEP